MSNVCYKTRFCDMLQIIRMRWVNKIKKEEKKMEQEYAPQVHNSNTSKCILLEAIFFMILLSVRLSIMRYETLLIEYAVSYST